MNFLFYAPQMAAYGGMERHICSLAQAACAAGHTVRMVTTSNSLGAELRAEIQHPNLTLSELAVARGRASALRKAYWLLGEALRARRTPWDVVYTNGQSALARLMWLSARNSTRVIHHHHTAADAREQLTWSPGFRAVLRSAPELVACSRATQHALGRAASRADVHYLPYLTPTPAGAAPQEDRAVRRDGPLHFGFIGRLVPEKGIARLCALSQRPDLNDVTWHVHGAGPEYPPMFFDAYPNVNYHGAYAGPRQLGDILNRLDAVVLLSTHNEGMPLSLIEAMASGLPWIATDRGGTRELALSPSNSLVIPPQGSFEADAAAVREMADRIRRGSTSRIAQYESYRQHLAPHIVATSWCSYMERGARQPQHEAEEAPVQTSLKPEVERVA